MTRIAPFTRAAARRLRAAMTPQERRLWQQLRDLNRRLGTHFRRQAPIGRFIADFADLGRRLVIEVDGGQHGGVRDSGRDALLQAEGFVVLRFWNNDVDGNMGGVMQTVLDRLEADPPPHPSPTRGEGGALASVPAQPAERTPRSATRASPPPCGEGLGVGGSAQADATKGATP